MFKVGFSNEKYVQMQSQKIRDRIGKFGGKLYLEFYYLMEAPEDSAFAGETDTDEKLVWLPLDELDKYDVRPVMLKSKLKEAIESSTVMHIVNNDIGYES